MNKFIFPVILCIAPSIITAHERYDPSMFSRIFTFRHPNVALLAAELNPVTPKETVAQPTEKKPHESDAESSYNEDVIPRRLLRRRKVRTVGSGLPVTYCRPCKLEVTTVNFQRHCKSRLHQFLAEHYKAQLE